MSKRTESVSKSKVIMTIITIVFACLIFLQSALPAEASNSESVGFTTFLNNFLLSLKLNVVLGHAFVRKLAHFTEFFVFGILLTATSCTYTSRPHRRILSLLFFALFTAVSDETIQMFVSGRFASLSDVHLDFFGALVGIGIALLIKCIKNAFHR